MMQSTEDRLGVDDWRVFRQRKVRLNSVVVILGMTRFFAPRQPDTIYDRDMYDRDMEEPCTY